MSVHVDVNRGGYNVNHLIEAITIAKTEGSYLKVFKKKYPDYFRLLKAAFIQQKYEACYSPDHVT